MVIVKSGSANPTGVHYADGIAALNGPAYASDEASNGNNFTLWKAGVGCCPTAAGAGTFPNSGYTTSIAIYLDTAWAAAHPGVLFDWDSAISQSPSYIVANGSNGFLSDLIFNASTTPSGYSGGTGFVVQASQNSQPGSAYAENPCSPLVQPSGGCVAPVVITNSGWYTFTHHFHADSNGDGFLAVDMTITDANNNVVKTWSAAPLYGSTTCGAGSSPCAVRVVDAGGPAYGWFDAQQISGLPLQNAVEKPGT